MTKARGEAALVRRQSRRVSLHVITLVGVEIPVVYDRLRNRLVTALPREAIDRQRMGRACTVKAEVTV